MRLMTNLAELEDPGGLGRASKIAMGDPAYPGAGVHRLFGDLAAYCEGEATRRRNGCMEPAEFVLEFDSDALSIEELQETVLRQGNAAKMLAEQGLLFAAALSWLLAAGLHREIQLRQAPPLELH